MPKPSLFYLALWWESLFYPQWMCHLHPQFQHFINAVILFLWKRLHLIKISNIIIVPFLKSSSPNVCKVFRSNHVSNYWFKIYLMHCLTTRWSIVDYWCLIYVLEARGLGLAGKYTLKYYDFGGILRCLMLILILNCLFDLRRLLYFKTTLNLS